ncbi:acetyl hydrolase [Kaistia algarum]|uniref:alpha/beta hydrolase n=1 Tax=Kaistia algarum TaxID=2083279 RepID=UPI000CE8F605|nr:alpha/beta hydrolase [Kaistia algarum]MCX5512639.1 alpha/beta hydrolase [Kaistia algarum]PPE81846.1 acetyl hydrolase [Kaistia algarum]
MFEEILVPSGVRSLPLDPKLQASVEERNRQPALGELPIAESKRRFLAARPLPAGGYGDGVVTEDRTIPGEGGPIPVRVYRDGAKEGPLPILVYFHGGGFVLGNLDSHDIVCRRFCRGQDLLVLSVDYRLAPEHPYPAATDDGWSALRFAASEGASIGGDPTRLALAGDSAGGMLAIATALRARDEGGPALRALVPFYPMMDLVAVGDYPSYRAFGDGSSGLTTRDVEWFVDLYCARERRHDAYASPALVEELAGLPPTYTVLAERDVLHDEGRAFAIRLGDLGRSSTLVEVAGVNHGFLSTDLGLDSVDLVFEGIHEWLGRRLAD